MAPSAAHGLSRTPSRVQPVISRRDPLAPPWPPSRYWKSVVTAPLHPATLLLGVAFLVGTLAYAQAPDPADLPYKIEVNVNKVLVPVVVRDKQGNAVGTLKKEDFQVFDNNKSVHLSGFTIERRDATETSTAPTPANQALPSPTPVPSAVHSTPTPARFVVFVFDDMHLSPEDLVHAQKAGAKVLADSLSDSDMAVVISLSGATNSGLTRDRAKLQQAILSLRTRGLFRSTGSDCPNIDYYQADLIANKHSDTALTSAIQDVLNCSPGMDAQRDRDTAERLAESAARRALTMGHQDVQSTFATIGAIVQKMAALPGQRTLILVSPGFISIESDTLAQESRIIDLAAQANITISALDARGLYTTDFTASDHSPSLIGQNFQTSSDSHRSSLTLAENPMAELADGTGGTFFHNSNDLNAGFKRLTQAPEYVYLLEYSLGTPKPDGSYHRLKVKVDRDALRLQARQGYFALKPKKDKK